MTSHSKRPETNTSGLKRLAIKLFALCLLLVITGYTYNQGTSGDLFYDDLSFLAPLESLETYEDSRQFITDGSGGPLGRRIALISFLPHADNWPDNSQVARQINVLIHLTNGALLFLLTYQLLRLRNEFNLDKCYWVALMAAGLWLLLPILASTSLITVQRWTGLSACFGLMGLNVFLSGYHLQSRKPLKGLILQGFGLGFFTLLALFTKESGALFPIYALVINVVLLNHLAAPGWLKRIRHLVLWAGLLALLIYLSPLYHDWFSVNTFRGWSSFERLQTQFVLLWQYLQLSFIPRVGFYGPFHDDVQLILGLLPIIAFTALMLVTLLAYFFRGKSPWPLFALLWFFAGHLIESTVIQVELMFEHRNYIAVFGVCLALAVMAWQVRGSLSKVIPALLCIYILMMWGALYATTNIWGNSIEAAENWVKHHPSSPRAIMHLSHVYQSELGNPSYSVYVLDQASPKCINCLDIDVQAMLFQCGSGDTEQIRSRFDQILLGAHTARASIALMDSFYPLQELLENGGCPPLSLQDAYQLTERLIGNQNYGNWQYHVHLRFHAAYFAKELGNTELALSHLQIAEELQPNVMPILQMQVYLLLAQNNFDAALAKVAQRRKLTDRNRFMSDEALASLENSINEAQREADRSNTLLQ